MAGLAILSRTELLLVVLGGLFADGHAVGHHPDRLVQVHPNDAPAPGDGCSGWRRCTTTSSSAGWEEITIIVRFWIMAGHGRRVRDGPVLRRLHRQWLTRRPTSPGAACWCAASASPARRPRGRCSPRGGRVLLTDSAASDRPWTTLVRPGRALARRADASCPPVSTWSSPRPGCAPTDPLLPRRGRARRRRCWGEVELAWRLRGPAAAPWLAVTGTNGKTTTVHMLESILRAAGRRALAVGNVGVPIIDAVLAAEPYDVLAVELSSYQLHLAPSHRARGRRAAEPGPRPPRLARLAAPPTPRPRRGCGAAPSRSATLDDPHVAALLGAAPAGSASSVHARPSRPRASSACATACSSTARSATAASLLPRSTRCARPARTTSPTRWPPPRSPGPSACRAAAIAAGLRAFAPDPHRNQLVAERGRRALGRRQQGDQPARRRAASLRAYERIVWIAGGQLKGAPRRRSGRRGCAAAARARCCSAPTGRSFAAALRRHAPDVPRDHRRQHRRWGHDRGGARRGRARPPRRHRAARAGGRLLRHVRRLRGPRATRSPPPLARWRMAGYGATA